MALIDFFGYQGSAAGQCGQGLGGIYGSASQASEYWVEQEIRRVRNFEKAKEFERLHALRGPWEAHTSPTPGVKKIRTYKELRKDLQRAVDEWLSGVDL